MSDVAVYGPGRLLIGTRSGSTFVRVRRLLESSVCFLFRPCKALRSCLRPSWPLSSACSPTWSSPLAFLPIPHSSRFPTSDSPRPLWLALLSGTPTLSRSASILIATDGSRDLHSRQSSFLHPQPRPEAGDVSRRPHLRINTSLFERAFTNPYDSTPDHFYAYAAGNILRLHGPFTMGAGMVCDGTSHLLRRFSSL